MGRCSDHAIWNCKIIAFLGLSLRSALKAETIIVFFDEYVLLGTTEKPANLADSTFLGGFDQPIKHIVFRVAAQHPATHQPCVDFPNGWLRQPTENYPNQPVITHSVSQMERCGPALLVRSESLDLGL